MFQLMLLGHMNHAYSTRQLESACHHDTRFPYILNGRPAPDHNRFWRFIRKHLREEVAEALFYQLVELLAERQESAYAHVFADGTKIEANANRYSFVWAKSTER